jgi:signal peptidase I
MNAAAETRAQARREAELVAAADKGTKAYYAQAGYGRLFGIIGGTLIVAAVAQHFLRKQDFLLGSLLVFLAVFILSTIGSATPWGVRSRVRGEAKSLWRSGDRLFRRYRPKLGEVAAAEVEEALARIGSALENSSGLPALQARQNLDAALDRHLAFARKGAVREYTESIGGAILVALLLRAFAFEPFHIPSGSMIPTLLVGDFIFVNKMSYGLRVPFTDPATVHKLMESAPRRGDVVVFINPARPGDDYVKRVVGIPGDRIDVRNDVLYVNGAEQKRTDVGDFTYQDRSEYTDKDMDVVAHQYIEDLDGKEHPILVRQDAPPGRDGSFTVEPGRVFVMGDNRDNSLDSRIPAADGGVGFVPQENLVARADMLLMSSDPSVGWFDLSQWGHAFRLSRFFTRIN